eukprot:symbB.v1.2.034828.t1/scaffold4561.1/size37971/7
MTLASQPWLSSCPGLAAAGQGQSLMLVDHGALHRGRARLWIGVPNTWPFTRSRLAAAEREYGLPLADHLHHWVSLLFSHSPRLGVWPPLHFRDLSSVPSLQTVDGSKVPVGGSFSGSRLDSPVSISDRTGYTYTPLHSLGDCNEDNEKADEENKTDKEIFCFVPFVAADDDDDDHDDDDDDADDEGAADDDDDDDDDGADDHDDDDDADDEGAADDDDDDDEDDDDDDDDHDDDDDDDDIDAVTDVKHDDAARLVML